MSENPTQNSFSPRENVDLPPIPCLKSMDSENSKGSNLFHIILYNQVI